MPKIVDHDHRRKQIAMLTLEVMRAVGIENASIRGIAQRGGISMGVLTHYFKTKDDLVVLHSAGWPTSPIQNSTS